MDLGQGEAMPRPDRTRALNRALACALGLALAWALWQSVHRPGYDFATYHDAWRRVLAGEGAGLYREMPAYLYAPVFAVAFAPLALLPPTMALFAWHAAKLALLAAAFRALRDAGVARGLAPARATTLVLGAALFGIRPLLLEIRLGQLNAILLAAAVVVWLGRERPRPRGANVARWACLTVLAASKLLLLPLIGLPWLRSAGAAEIRRAERAGILVGLAVVATLPLLATGIEGWLPWHLDWLTNLRTKGVAAELGNSSVAATAARLIGGAATTALYAPGRTFDFSWLTLPPLVVSALTLATQLAAMLAFVALARRHSRRDEVGFLAVALALVHLATPTAYRYYFVTLIPLAFAWLLGATTDADRRGRAFALATGGAALLALNPGALGIALATWIDAYSPWLVAQLALAIGVLRDARRD
jgi:hypothetical protein